MFTDHLSAVHKRSADAESRPRQVTVSVVSHGQADWTRSLLEQLSTYCAAHIAQAIVTFNLEEPTQWDDMDLKFPVVQLHNDKVKGFGCNHNQAFKHCESAWFLVINPDIRLTTDVLDRLLSATHANTGLLAPCVWEPNTYAATPERDVITPWEVFGGRLWGRSPPKTPVWFPGMFMLFRSKAYAQVQGFDERFHMYCEDFDICTQLRTAGWALHRDTGTHVQHLAQRDSHARPQYLMWHLRSLCRLWFSLRFWRYWLALRRTP